MTDSLKPNKKHQHLYAILRYEVGADPSTPIEVRVTVKKVVRDPHQAAQEVERLNELNKQKGYYFFQVTRFEEVPAEAGEATPLQSGASESQG